MAVWGSAGEVLSQGDRPLSCTLGPAHVERGIRRPAPDRLLITSGRQDLNEQQLAAFPDRDCSSLPTSTRSVFRRLREP